MRQTIGERILNATRKHGQFNRSVARKTFRQLDNAELTNSVMREAYRLEGRNQLRRTSAGTFKLV